MKGDCKGKCGSLRFLLEHRGRETERPFYHYENWCKKCQVAYPKPLVACPCCGHKLKTRSYKKPKEPCTYYLPEGSIKD